MADGPSPTGVGGRVDAQAPADRSTRETSPSEKSLDSMENGPRADEVTVGSVTVAVSDERAGATAENESEHRSGRVADGVGNLDPVRWGRLAAASLAELGEYGEASLTFVDRAAIAELNAAHMGVDGETDVLSFPLDAVPIESAYRIDDEDHPNADDRSSDDRSPDDRSPDDHAAPRLLGDIVICADVAADNAPSHAGTFDDELALLVVHGTLHLLGYDHAEADQARAMRQREAELLAELFWRGPVPAGFRFDHADEPSGAVSQGRST